MSAHDTTNYNLLGYSTALDGNTLVSGAPLADHGGSRSGSAYSAQLAQWTPIPDSGQGEANGTSYAVSGLTNGWAYAYRIRAVNDAGTGAPSAQVDAMPAAAIIDVSNLTPASGEPVTLTAQLVGLQCGSLGYAWYRVGDDYTARRVGPENEAEKKGNYILVYTG